MAGNLTKFPLDIDSFEKKLDILISDLPYMRRIKSLQEKDQLTPTEADELTSLLIQFKNKRFTAQDYNQLTEAMVAMQTWLKNNTEDWLTNAQNEFSSYIDNKKDEIITEQANVVNTINTTKNDAINSINTVKMNAESNIQTTKDSALMAIENKKENILTYMDSTTAGQIRNDIGVMGELTTTAKESLVAAVNEVNAKQAFHVGNTPPSDTSILWIDTN